MENTVSGTVENVTSSPGRGRAEGKTAWAVTIAGESYSVGFRKPEVAVGDLVTFRVEVKDGKWKSAYDLRRLDSGPREGPPAPRPAPGSSAPSSGAASDQLRLIAASVILASWASTTRPLDWSLDDFLVKVFGLADQLKKA